MKPLFFPNDPQFWFETQRALGHAAYGGADIGEVFATAERITAGDYDGWHDEWLAVLTGVGGSFLAVLFVTGGVAAALLRDRQDAGAATPTPKGTGEA